MTYPNGLPIQPGDKVLLENGAIEGEVIQIIDTPQAKIDLGLQPHDQDSVLFKRDGKRIQCITADAIQSDNTQLLSRASD